MTYAIRSTDTGAWYEKTKAFSNGQTVDIYQESIQRAAVFRKLKDADKKCAELYHCEVLPVKVSRTDGLATMIYNGMKPGRKNRDDQHGGARAGKETQASGAHEDAGGDDGHGDRL